MLSSVLMQASSIDSILTENSEVEDSFKVRYSDNETFWGFSLGYFPIWDEYFESGGISATLYTESDISKIFKLGWSFQINLAIDGGGYLALNGYLSHPIKFDDHTLLIKGGAGIATIIYPSLVGFLGVEYLLWEIEEIAISVSISECVPGFQMFMPPIISIGVLF